MKNEIIGIRRVASRRFLLRGVTLLLAFAFFGCAGTYQTLTPPLGANPNPEDTLLDEQQARNALDEASRMIASGQYAQGILRLERVIDRFGDTKAGTEARYLIARTYQDIGGNEKARHYYADYLARALPGDKADFSRRQLSVLEGLPEGSVEVEDPNVVYLRRQIENAPEEMTQPLELAEYLWQRARYQEASDVYVQLLTKWPGLKADKTINQRIAFDVDGTYTLLTPAEVIRRSREANPLALYNVQSFLSGRGAGGSAGFADVRQRYYHVAGELVNQGSSTLREVAVRITVYGVGKRIYDTRSVNIGTLPPGERRAFSERFQNFDNIENIQDYECTATYVQ